MKWLISEKFLSAKLLKFRSIDFFSNVVGLFLRKLDFVLAVPTVIS